MMSFFNNKAGRLLALCLLALLVPAAHAQEATTRTLLGMTVRDADAATTQARELNPLPEITPVPPGQGLRFNFRGVPLDTVLDYLGKAAGFIIVREAEVQGRIDVVSHKPLSREESVALLNTVLNQKGYAAIQSENTLKIVSLEDARKRDIPVKVGREADKIKKTDEMVTQIIPVRYTNVTQLIKNLEMLLPSYAVITANEGSNAIVLTATQTDIRRMVEIIAALDTSVANSQSLKVYTLQHSDATELAKLVSDLFKPQATASSQNNRGGGGLPFPPMMMFGRRGGMGGGDNNNNNNSRIQPQVTAVADTRTNAIVVSAPDDMMATIDQLVTQIDTSTMQICEVRVFPLQHADAQNMTQLINDIYKPQSTSSSSNQGFVPGFMRRFMPPDAGQSNQAPAGSRKAQETQVLAVADVRTNSVVVNADKDLMEQIAPMVDQLDNNPARERKVHVYPLKYADPIKTAQILQDMFGDTTRRSSNLNTNVQSGIFGGFSNNNNGNYTSGRSSRGSGGSVPSGLGLN